MHFDASPVLIILDLILICAKTLGFFDLVLIKYVKVSLESSAILRNLAGRSMHFCRFSSKLVCHTGFYVWNRNVKISGVVPCQDSCRVINF